MPSKEPAKPPARPWWREPMVWLVVAGPAVVVVAGIVTAAIAVRGADEVITTVPTARPDGMTPAVQARNHAATAEEGERAREREPQR